MSRRSVRILSEAALAVALVGATAAPAMAAATPPPAASCQGFVNGFVNSNFGGTGQGNQEVIHEIGGQAYSATIVAKAQGHPC